MTLGEVSDFLEDKSLTANLSRIIEDCTEISCGKYRIQFDLSLVRGQGYYTGTVFEVNSDRFGGTVAGGGRYDNLIEKFTGVQTCACGFSIGFERIFCILSDMNRTCPSSKKLALIYSDSYVLANKTADTLRENYDVTVFQQPKKLRPFLDKLRNMGYCAFCFEDGEVKPL